MGHAVLFSYLLVLCLSALSWFFAGGGIWDRNTVAIRLWLFLTSAWVSIWAITFMIHFGVKYW